MKLNPLQGFAQKIPLVNPDTLHQISSDRYQGGEDAFYQFLARKMSYPKKARINNVSGVAIVSIVINAEGKIKLLDMLNPLENGIEEEIIRVLTHQEGNWNPSNNFQDEVYILPLIFKLGQGRIESTAGTRPQFLLEPLVVTALALEGGNFDFQYYDDFQEKFNKYQKKAKHRKALLFLNRLIALNPFDKALHLRRIDLEKKLAIRVRSCLDLRFINYLLKDHIPTAYLDIHQECLEIEAQRK